MLTSATVLLVDDHAILRDGLKMVLDAQPGITVVGEAENGREALDLVEQLRPDVVVIADLLTVSIKTVQTHRARIMEKLGAHDRTDLVRYAMRKGIITGE